MTLNGDNSLTIREWQPGDGLTCRYAKRSPKEIPCGPPVAAVTQLISAVRRGDRYVTNVVCLNHLPGSVKPSEVRTDADRAAREAVIVAHWDEYMEQLAAQVKRLQADRLSDLPQALQQLLTGDEETTP